MTATHDTDLERTALARPDAEVASTPKDRTEEDRALEVEPGETPPPEGEGGETPPSQPDGPQNAKALLRLGVAVAAIVALFVGFNQTNLLIVIVAIVLIVMVHELGHFAAAKWSHMKVTEYFLGFGPKVWSIRRGETEYGIKAIPAGGYVKIPGMTNLEEVPPEDEPRTYRQQPFHNRLAVAVAGSFMHIVMAVILAWAALAIIGAPSTNQVTISGFVHWPGHAQNAAQKGGVKVGDTVVAVNGHNLTSESELQSAIERSPNKAVALGVVRDGRHLTLHVTPAEGSTSNGQETLGSSGRHPVGLLGVQLGPGPSVAENPLSAVPSSFNLMWRITTGEVAGLGHVFSPHGLSTYAQQVANPHVAAQDAKNGTPRLQSIVGIVQTATQGAQAGTFYLLEILVILNVVLAIVNMLPMLPLDGGHVAIAVYERIRSRKGRPYHADAAKLLPVAYAVVVLLVVLFTTTLYLDITHPVANPFHG